MDVKTLKANIGEVKIGINDEILCAHGIGSCVVIVCYDRNNPIAGMLHAILPEKKKKDTIEGKYVDTGTDLMVKELIKKGASINNIEAKIFGGAKMFDTMSDAAAIGERNITKAREVLEKKRIEIKGEDVGSNYGRTIEFSVVKKMAEVKSYMHGTKIV